MEFTHEQLQADIDFLLARSDAAGSFSCSEDRWTGVSSNNLVSFAYGGIHDYMPSDRSDYAACVRTVVRLPAHRRTPAVIAALWRAKEAYLENFPEERNAIERNIARKAAIAELDAWEIKRHAQWVRRRNRRKAA